MSLTLRRLEILGSVLINQCDATADVLGCRLYLPMLLRLFGRGSQIGIS
jgi:hypothetical protein